MVKIKFIMSGMWVFLQPFIKVLLTQGGTILMTACMDAVRSVATDMQGQPGAVKRDAALGLITQRLASEGVKMASSVINLALEAAVVKLKST
jgi:hypothetical protein